METSTKIALTMFGMMCVILTGSTIYYQKKICDNVTEGYDPFDFSFKKEESEEA